MRTSWKLAGLLALLFSVTSWAAQKGQVSTRKGDGISTRIEHLDSSEFPRIEATVQVFTPERQVLQSDQFRVAEDGQKVDKFQLVVDPRPIYLVLVLDESGSMKDSMAHLKKAAFEFLDILDDRVRTQLITFSDQVHARTGFIQDDRLVKRKVASAQADGGTRLFDAVDLAAHNVGPYPEEVRRVVVTFTDGRDGKAGLTGQLSKASARDVARYSRSHGVPLYFLGLGKGVNRMLLTKLAAATGGEALFSARTEELRSIFQRMAQSLGTSYRLVYKTPKPKADGTVRKLQVASLRKGGRDQGSAQYKAPKPSSSGLSPSSFARKKGFAAYRKVLGALMDLGSYGVRVDSSVTTPQLDGLGGVDLTTNLDLTHVVNVGTSMDMNLNLGMENIGVQVVRKADDAYLKVGSLQGADLETRVNLKDRQDVKWLQNPVETVIGWLGVAGKKETKVAPPSDGSNYVYNAPDKIRMVGADGKSRGVLTFDRKSFLPTHLISIDAGTGASSNVRFSDWRVKGNFHIDLPDAEKISAEAEKFALRTAEAALLTAGSALRTADAAVDASVAAGQAGLRAGLEGARKGMKVANRSLQMIQPWTNQGVEIAVKTLGGVSKMLGSEDFRKAVTAGPREARYWTQYAGDFDATFEKKFSSSMEQFDQNLGSFLTDLDSKLEAQNQEFESNMLAFGKNLGEDMTQLGEDLAASGTKLGADIAADATDIAMDAAGGATRLAGEIVEDSVEMTEEIVEESLDVAEEATEEALDAARAAQNIEAIGDGAGLSGLKNLGQRLQGLGASMNQGQGADGGEGEEDW